MAASADDSLQPLHPGVAEDLKAEVVKLRAKNTEASWVTWVPDILIKLPELAKVGNIAAKEHIRQAVMDYDRAVRREARIMMRQRVEHNRRSRQLAAMREIEPMAMSPIAERPQEEDAEASLHPGVAEAVRSEAAFAADRLRDQKHVEHLFAGPQHAPEFDEDV